MKARPMIHLTAAVWLGLVLLAPLPSLADMPGISAQ